MAYVAFQMGGGNDGSLTPFVRNVQCVILILDATERRLSSNGHTNNFRYGMMPGYNEESSKMSQEPGRQPTIFLVEEDDDTRPILKHNLKTYGYRVLLALDEEDALERIVGISHADLLLVNLIGKTPDEVLQIGRRIREHARYDGHTPLVVIAEKFGADVEGTDVNVSGNDWVTYLEDPGQLRNLLGRLTSKSDGE